MGTKTIISLSFVFLFCSIFAFAALDLKFVTAISQSPNPATAGNSVTFTVSFRPFDATVTNMKIIGGVDAKQFKERTYASIAANATRTDTMTWTAEAGVHKIWFELDPAHSCNDSNYSNNRIETTITVGGGGPAGQPNLQLKVNYSPASFVAGNSVAVTLLVSNIGNADSVPCDMFLKKGGTVLQSFSLPAIAAGNETSKNYSWSAECGAVLSAKADSNNVVVESNEGDNEWSKQMDCTPQDTSKPDLELKVSFSPGTFEADQEITFNFTVNNIGTAPSVPTDLLFYDGHQPTSTILQVPAIAPGDHYSTSKTWKVICNSLMNILVVNKNNELNESNNKWERKMGCGKFLFSSTVMKREMSVDIDPKDKPDLTVKILGIIKNPATGKYLLNLETANIGTHKSAECKLLITFVPNTSGTLLDVPALEANEKFSFADDDIFRWESHCGRKVSVKIDAAEKVRESNEDNNVAEKTFLCPNLSKQGNNILPDK